MHVLIYWVEVWPMFYFLLWAKLTFMCLFYMFQRLKKPLFLGAKAPLQPASSEGLYVCIYECM